MKKEKVSRHLNNIVTLSARLVEQRRQAGAQGDANEDTPSSAVILLFNHLMDIFLAEHYEGIV